MGALGFIAKAIIGLFAVILGLIGVGCLTVGIIGAVELGKYSKGDLVNNTYVWSPVSFVISLGLLLFLIGVFGVGGTCCGNKSLVKAFAVLMVFLITMEITAVVLGVVYRGKIHDNLDKGIRDGIKRGYNVTKTDTHAKKALDELQKDLDCCGAEGPNDYITQKLTIPKVCCKDEKLCTGLGPFETEGCTHKIQRLLKKYSNVFIGIGAGIAALEIIAVIYSCHAANKDSDETAKMV
eukprot:scpid90442/ scgid16534/ CD63 antigen